MIAAFIAGAIGIVALALTLGRDNLVHLLEARVRSLEIQLNDLEKRMEMEMAKLSFIGRE